MQASLARVVRMVSVDDLGQGSEAIRILGVKWLPSGAARQSVDAQGNPRPAKENDRAAPGEGQIDNADNSKRGDGQDNNMGGGSSRAAGGDEQTQQEQEMMREGMEAEEGDFVNVELGFAYRARSSGRSIKRKAKNAHFYLKFYLPLGVAVPVWVELRGIVGIIRPLHRDVPGPAPRRYPKSLTLDLKDMLVGDDFKKDTLARGVVLVYIKQARGFKEGDGGIGPLRGSSDAYVSVSWGKFGKPIASTRVIADEQEPNWNEWASLLVTPNELNAEETIRLQIWDSDKYTADDNLGRVELSLKELISGAETKNRICDREDELRAKDPGEKMPGTLTYFPSGILGIQIHNITGLEVARLNRKRPQGDGEEREDGAEQADEHPDSYCVIVLNHGKIYRTRTKPKNSKPFFNAGTERFVKDWRNAEVIISVRDNREGEDNPLLGIVYLLLRRVFEHRSQVMEVYPLAGGIGYGRIGISMVWRSVELTMPQELMGWDYGTLEVKAPKSFRHSSLVSDSNPALAVFWLSEIPDEEERTVRLPIWKGGKANLKRARSCCDYQGLETNEKPIGEIELSVRFWRGLSGFHKDYAAKSRHGEAGSDSAVDPGGDSEAESVASRTAQGGRANERFDSQDKDTAEADKRKMLRGGATSGQASQDGGTSTAKKLPSQLKAQAASWRDGLSEGHDDGSWGAIAQIQDYKKHHKQLHRQHRGVMQWRTARTLDWMAGKVKEGAGKVGELFEHGEKDQGIETEV
ncbi:hypothetical protein QBC46DRAFT_414188 [Diplogelasinospora grovesii]|uniref:C2 domain-containing protein n=1 Tax=Diplogelasinospora grovesii TaxID=303347 RepID=A0AAN6RYT4_9PEZI|nr:hypothetical protein QBC46DRAFT_414188 [Diplogelasinospora grovesii]